MKRTLLLLAGASIIALSLTSCGSSKKTAAINPYVENNDQVQARVKVVREECEEEAMKNTEFLRGYGIGTSGDNMMARDLATAAARNEIVNQVQVSASNMLEKFNNQHSSNANDPIMTREDQGKATQMIRSMAEETLNGARVICSNTYMVGQSYEVHVCVELSNVDFTKKVYNKLSNEEKLIIDYEADKFKDDFNEELELYRQRKAQGL